MLGTASSRSAARSSRLLAARDYATECVQHAEIQDNVSLEHKILGNLSTIVMEAIDCLRSEQPFRSPSLKSLSLELLTYLRQHDKPIVNFACAFTMLMSELEGMDPAERTGGPRSYSNSIPDMHQDNSVSSDRTAPSASVYSPAPPPPPPRTRPPNMYSLKQEAVDDGGRDSVEMYGESEMRQHQMEEEGEAGMADHHANMLMMENQNDLLTRMIANFATQTPSSSNSILDPARSEMARNQPKSKIGRFESRDEELAVMYNLPVTATEIENMPDQEMSNLMKSEGLTEEQKNIMRQIRKRARSKISSREYRKRKAGTAASLALHSTSLHADPSHTSESGYLDQKEEGRSMSMTD